VAAILGESADRDEARRSFDHLVDDGEQMRSVALPQSDILGYGPIRDDLDAGRLGLVWGTAVAFADQPGKVMATSAEMARSMSAQMNVMDRVMESKSEVVISSPYLIPGSIGVQAFGDLRKRNVKVTILTNSFAANDVPLAHTGYARYRVDLLRTGIDIYELSPTRIQRNERLMLPGTSLGRLHAKTAVIDQAMVYIGSVNLDPRSENLNTELGLFARCPELAKEVIRVIDISKLQSSYRLRFASDSQSLQWLATDDQGDVVLSEEPEVTPFMRLKVMLLAPFVPEQLL
jgi:putative cardiolipin synthase